ncbi:MAG: hypothetical protein KJ727_04275, partial [Acidobacteria bacterium]|nr:hypothetical protein [Acidobacteriota bacterium]
VVFLPSPPNWFFLQEAEGSTVLYVLLSASSHARWNELYEKGEMEAQLRRYEEDGDDKTTVLSFPLRFMKQ